MGNDSLFGLNGYDQLYGEDGNDTLDGGLSADLLDGGNGLDTARYNNSASAVTVNLATGEAFGGEAEGDILVSIERIKGSVLGGDTLTGDGASNTLWGWGGSDTIKGGAGGDVLYGGDGNDVIEGGANNDSLSGEQGNDTFVFATGFGKDTITDFTAGIGAGDVIRLTLGITFDAFAEVIAVASQLGANTVIIFDVSTQITLTNVTVSNLVADDLSFM